MNRARALRMDRRWVQAVFSWPEAAAAVQPQPLGEETEADGAVSTGGDLACVFAPQGPLETRAVDVDVDCAGTALRVRLVGRDWQHVERATGSMLWEGARALAAHLAARPALVAGARVLELGAGAAALPSWAAAAAGARSVIATDGHPEVLQLLRHNLTSNDGVQRSSVAVRPAALRWSDGADALARLDWDGAPQEARLVVLGADVVYDPSALPQLLATAAAALRGSAAGGVLLLCHVDGRGGMTEGTLLEAAAAAGLALRCVELDERAIDLLSSLALPPVRLLQGGLAEQ